MIAVLDPLTVETLNGRGGLADVMQGMEVETADPVLALRGAIVGCFLN